MVQGSAADIIKTALIAWSALREWEAAAPCVACIHDEVRAGARRRTALMARMPFAPT